MIKLENLNFDELKPQIELELEAIIQSMQLDEFNKKWLSKDGLVKSLFKQLKDVPSDKKASVAEGLNKLKTYLEENYDLKLKLFSKLELEKKLGLEYYDLSLPSNFSGLGSIHPINQIERKITSILKPFGFENVYGPEVESEYYCFDALNIPAYHPARDMQDTFYTENGMLLRTHTTSIQARVLEECSKRKDQGLPIKISAFGKTYRNETEDASHQAMFHQFELVWLEKGLTLSNLMALIEHILKNLYGNERKVKFVPKFYPYTEPSLGPQINCVICDSKGCSACSGAGWVTVGGSGMIHRKVLKEFGYDPEEVNGFAFGLGTSRLAAQMYNIPKLKMVYENDLRILKEIV